MVLKWTFNPFISGACSPLHLDMECTKMHSKLCSSFGLQSPECCWYASSSFLLCLCALVMLLQNSLREFLMKNYESLKQTLIVAGNSLSCFHCSLLLKKKKGTKRRKGKRRKNYPGKQEKCSVFHFAPLFFQFLGKYIFSFSNRALWKVMEIIWRLVFSVGVFQVILMWKNSSTFSVEWMQESFERKTACIVGRP